MKGSDFIKGLAEITATAKEIPEIHESLKKLLDDGKIILPELEKNVAYADKLKVDDIKDVNQLKATYATLKDTIKKSIKCYDGLVSKDGDFRNKWLEIRDIIVSSNITKDIENFSEAVNECVKIRKPKDVTIPAEEKLRKSLVENIDLLSETWRNFFKDYCDAGKADDLSFRETKEIKKLDIIKIREELAKQ